MSTQPVPHRYETTFEVAAPADVVWQAIATQEGVSAWFLPHEIEGRVGGRFVVHMGETDSTGEVTGWDPPRRFAYEEDWATVIGRPDADVTPLATEFLVEARSGGSCVVRVVTSAFGTGADWENEFFDEMSTFWEPYFQLLRTYVARFAGQTAVRRNVGVTLDAPPPVVAPAVGRALGVEGPGQAVDAWGLSGTTLAVGYPYTMFEVDDPAPGYVVVASMHAGADRTNAEINAWLFGPDADNSLDAAMPAWRAWLQDLPVDAPSDGART